jgi:hypothetical protein
MSTLEERLAQLQGGDGAPSGQQGDNATEGGDAGKANEAELTRTKQLLAAAQEDAKKALPYVNAVEALAKTTVGRQIIEKLNKGEDLTSFQLAKLEKAVSDGGGGDATPLTMEALEKKLAETEGRVAQKVGETLRANESARVANDRLEKWASKEFKGYEKVRGSEVWNETFAGVLGLIQNETIKVPAGTDPWEVAIRRTYHTVVSEDPDILKGDVQSAPDENERLAKILAAGSKASASAKDEGKGDLSGIAGGYYERMLNFAQSRPSGALAGKSYANRGANKKD